MHWNFPKNKLGTVWGPWSALYTGDVAHMIWGLKVLPFNGLFWNPHCWQPLPNTDICLSIPLVEIPRLCLAHIYLPHWKNVFIMLVQLWNNTLIYVALVQSCHSMYHLRGGRQNFYPHWTRFSHALVKVDRPKEKHPPGPQWKTGKSRTVTRADACWCLTSPTVTFCLHRLPCLMNVF